MKHGLTEQTYKLIKNVIESNGQYKIKLFGSRAKGTYKSNSDIDLAIFENLTKEEEYKIRDEFDKLDIAYKIDLVFVNENIKKELLNSILQEGVEF